MNSKPIVVITGSNGLIGTAVGRDLSDAFHVVGLDLKPPRQATPGVSWIQTDMTDEQSVREALESVRRHHVNQGNRIASVIHLAAYYDFSGEPSELYEKLTVEGTRRLLRELQALEVEQFVFSSTLLVMKPCQAGEFLTEESPVQAEWEYPESKLQAEAVIHRERGQIPAVVLRIAGVYDDFGHSPPITQQIARIHKRSLESYFYPGHKDHGQSFVHLEDVVRAFRRTVERRGQLAPEEVFLIGEPDVMTYEELQDQIGKLLHAKEWPSIRIPKPAAKVGAWVKDRISHDQAFIKPWMIDLADAHYPVSIDRARARLGWEPTHSLRNSISRIVGALRTEPLEWYRVNRIEPPDDIRAEDQEAHRTRGGDDRLHPDKKGAA